MISDNPDGLFITWNCYGTHLPGDEQGWIDHGRGWRDSQPLLHAWAAHQLKFDESRLTPEIRSACRVAVGYLVRRRGWQLHAFEARSNHCHMVVSAREHAPDLVRDQTKAELTKQLRKQGLVDSKQPVWAAKGWIVFLDDDEAIREASVYTSEAQDRKRREIDC